jgi:N-carbamoylputrescine amidase
VYVGIGFVETDGEDFYNSYALSTPEGEIAGLVRKTMAETYCFRCAHNSHVIDTALGRIGLGICADNHFVPMVRQMQVQSVDLMLMPHVLPGAFRAGGMVSQQDIDQSRKKARGMAPLYAHLLGVPAVFANAVGPRGPEKWAGMIGSLMTPECFHILGLSTIVDGDGMIKGELDQAEGILVADVNLVPARRVCIEPKSYGHYGGGWVHPLASPLTDLLCYVDAFFCGLDYRFSRERRQKARRLAGNQPPVVEGRISRQSG